MKVGFTGTRKGMTASQRQAVKDLVEQLGAVEGHHGDCVGADDGFHDICEELGVPVTVHPPENRAMRANRQGADSRPEKPYLERNRNIVNETDVLIAAPEGPEVRRSGTWSTIRYAWRKGVKFHIVMPEQT